MLDWNMANNLKEEVVPLKSRIWIAIADSACAVLGSLAAGATLTYFFTEWRGLDGKIAAFVWILYGIWNAVNDPLFGYISDRTKTKIGRRIPYIRFGTPFYALTFILCWVDWPGTSVDQIAMGFQMFFLLFLVDTLYTAIATSIYIMPYEMAISAKARGSIFIWKIIFMLIPLAIPLILIPIIKPKPGSDPTFFQTVMTLFGIVSGLLIFISTYFYEEKGYTTEEKQPPFFTALIESFKNKAFLVFLVISFTIIYIQTALMTGVLYFFDNVDVPALPLYISLAVGIIFGIFLWILKLKSWRVKKSLIIMSFLFALGCLLLLLQFRNVMVTSIAFFLFGIGFSGGMYLIPIINGEVIDFDEKRTGLRREGMYAGINSFITKPAISLAQAVFLWTIGIFGYIQGLPAGSQTESAQTGIVVGWVLVPCILLILSGIVLLYYPLDGPEWEQTKQELQRIHDEKEAEYLQKFGFK